MLNNYTYFRPRKVALMNKEIIEIFDVNTDAVATNRGFYYQYLNVLKKWITNYINGIDSNTYTEVDNDIKEVGNNLIFTQVKSYTTSLSLDSKEIKSSIFNFFLLYLRYQSLNQEIVFCFATNTAPRPRQKLLTNWINDQNLTDTNLLSACINKIKEILEKEINLRKNKKLEKAATKEAKEKIRLATQGVKQILSEAGLINFVKSIVWEFGNTDPDEAVRLLRKELEILLSKPIFKNRSPQLMFNVFISEIYKASQNPDENQRCLNNESIDTLLSHTDNELLSFVDNRIINLLSNEIEILKSDIIDIQNTQGLQANEIATLKNTVKNITGLPIPKELTLLPDHNSNTFLGWDNFLDEIHGILVDKKIVSLHSEGGMGKTSFAKKYLKTFIDYDHIIWINVEQSIAYSFAQDELLSKNLQIDFSIDDSIEKRFKFLLNEINKIEGNNLLIVDIQETHEDISNIKLLASLTRWHKLILTRNHIKNIPSLKLPKISFDEAKQIFKLFSSSIIEDDIFREFINFIDSNILVIELTAKTIDNSSDLTLISFLQSLKNQRLDSDEFNIDIEIDSENNVIRIFNFLIKKFALNNLTSDEQNYFEFLILLPSTDISIEDIILINGIEFYDQNKITIRNLIIALEKKGLVEYSINKDRINIHKVIKETIIYNVRSQTNPFASASIYIVWLTNRIMEGNNNPEVSFRFLRYAESILNSIKEDYRKSVYQPLLLLENELLFHYRFFINSDNEHCRWINLVQRSEIYFTNDNPTLAVMYNNLGLSYAYKSEVDSAIEYFKKSLQIFKKNEQAFVQNIIVISNNLSNTYLKTNDLVSALNIFNDVQSIRKKYSLYDDQQLAIEYRILAESYKITGDYNKAIGLLREGIKLHESLKISKRNDFYLSAYYNQLSQTYLLKEDFENTIKYQEKAVEILEHMNLNNSEHLFWMYEILLRFYRFKGLKNKELILIDKMSAFKTVEL